MDFDFSLETIIPDNTTLLTIGGPGALELPSGTTAQRPVAAVSGAIRWNSTLPQIEYYNGTSWLSFGGAVTSITGTADQITASAATGAVTLSISPNPILPGTGSVTIPSGTTAQRPGTPTTGMFRYNSTTGQYEFYDTSWQSIPGIIDKSTVQVTQTSLVSANLISFSVPANTLGTAGILRFKTGGTWARAAGSGGLTFTISYGGTNIWVGTSGNMTTNNTVAWSMELNLIANNSATAQTMVGNINFDATGSPTTGIGSIANSNTSPFTSASITGTSAIASTSAQTFQVAVVATAATSSLIKYYHTLELL